MPVTRPYLIVFNGVEHMVEATGPAGAVKHVVGAAVTELRPARGAEVAAWTRAGKDIPIAGTRANPAPVPAAEPALTPGQQQEAAEILHDDLVDWLRQNGADDLAMGVIGSIRSSGRMTLEQFDILRTAVPAFGDEIVMAINGVGPGDAWNISVDEVRGQLEDQPFEYAVVVGAISDAINRDVEAIAAAADPKAE